MQAFSRPTNVVGAAPSAGRVSNRDEDKAGRGGGKDRSRKCEKRKKIP